MDGEPRQGPTFNWLSPEIWIFPLVVPLPTASILITLGVPAGLLFNDTGVPLGKLLPSLLINFLLFPYSYGIFVAMIAGGIFYILRISKLTLALNLLATSAAAYAGTVFLFSMGPRLGILNLDRGLALVAGLPIALGALASGGLTSKILQSRHRAGQAIN